MPKAKRTSAAFRVPALVVLGFALLCAISSCDSVSNTAGDNPGPRVNDGDPGDGSWGGGGGSGSGGWGSDGGSSGGGTNSNDNDDDALAALLRDSDGDGTRDIDELANGTNPYDASEGGDLDGDGVPNAEDRDVDGDGLENADDPDIDGDGEENGEDDDADGDGEDAEEDEDDDGDGIPDDEDDDDDGDGEPDCDCEHGVCSAFGGLCFCDPGWQGESCDEFHCRDVRNCNNGTCVGPNACRCNSGWESVGSIPCVVYHCRQLRNCNNHGTCTGPNVCQCDTDWRGGLADCSVHSCDQNPASCDDGDPCTADTCNPSVGCENKEVTCLGFDICVNGECTSSCNSAADCADDQGCRDGGCFDCQSHSECRDSNPCTEDTCDQGTCLNERFDCDPGEECVKGKCVATCDDDDECEDSQSCSDGGCFEDCAGDSDCEDGEVCDTGTCIPEDQEEEEEEEAP